MSMFRPGRRLCLALAGCPDDPSDDNNHQDRGPQHNPDDAALFINLIENCLLGWIWCAGGALTDPAVGAAIQHAV